LINKTKKSKFLKRVKQSGEITVLISQLNENIPLIKNGDHYSARL